MKLEGGERLVLKNLLDLQGDSGENVEDFRVAAATKMAVEDLRDWLVTLEGKGFVERTRLTDGFSAYVTAKGKQAFRLTEPISSPKPAGNVASINAALLGGTGAPSPQPAATQKIAPLLWAIASWCARLGRLQRLRTVKWVARPPVLAHQLASAYPLLGIAPVQPSSGPDTDKVQAQASAQAPSGPTHQLDVFVWYSSTDRNKVEKLVQQLQDAGLKVCVDYRDMPVGESPQHWMEWQTEHCRHVLPVMTPDWLKSDWTAFEIMLAEDPTGRRHRLTPVMLETCDPPPGIKAVRNFANLTDPTIAGSEWERLLKTLREDEEPLPPLGPTNEQSARKGLRDLATLLQTPEVRDKVVTFKEVFRSACTQIALVSEFKMLHDKLQELQIGCRPIALLRRGAGSGEPDWDNLDVEGQNLLGLLDDLVKEARGVSFAAKERVWVVSLELAGKRFSQAVAGCNKDELNSACALIDETVVKRLFEFNKRLIDAVQVLNLPSLVGCLSEVRGKLEGMSLDEAASGRLAGFIKGLDALAEISERWASQVARHDDFQSIEDVLTTAHGAIRENFDIDYFLNIWAQAREMIQGSGGDAWPEPLRAAADAVSAAAGDRNRSKTEKLFQKFRDQISRLFKKADTDLLQKCRELQGLGKELATLLEMTSHG